MSPLTAGIHDNTTAQDKLVIVRESPYPNTIRVVNPGQTGITHVTAKSFLNPLVKKWPVYVCATDNMIIIIDIL
jgi:hypothetical protein